MCGQLVSRFFEFRKSKTTFWTKKQKRTEMQRGSLLIQILPFVSFLSPLPHEIYAQFETY